jgi:hypothetical protein
MNIMMWQCLALLLLFIVGTVFPPAVEARQGTVKGKGNEDVGRLVLRYAEALSNSQKETWAAVDLGCLTRQRAETGAADHARPTPVVQQCWDDTLKAHVEMVAQEAESGVFDAVGRGMGFGLLHDRHRATETWKEYPPAVFVSPAVVRRQHGPVPQVKVMRVSSPHAIALIGVRGQDPVGLTGQAVDVKVVYGDPLTAPLALRPEEVWWVSGTQRRFGPVREVVARFIVVSGLRKFGYPADRAVMNEALPGAPLIATTHYGLRQEAGRVFERTSPESSQGLLKGELVMGSARWWERGEIDAQFRDMLNRAAHLPSAEREGLLSRLLLLDPADPEAHALRGDDAYQAFLKQGITKGGLAAREDTALQRIAELYWTIQAQTWRQELTAVSEGYEPAADALYRAMASYEAVAQQYRAAPEQRRRLGTLTRWNNDPTAALGIHEALLRDTQPGTVEYGQVLAEIAWDRIQWVSWERRYDHPWLKQAKSEAEQAAELLAQSHDKIHAHYAQVAVESLMVPRNLDTFQQRMQRIKQDLDLIPGVKGLQGQLLANDLVKALSPDAAAIVLPTPPRSLEVLDVAVHANPPKQDIVWQWNFDQDQPGSLPAGFVGLGRNDADSTAWQVQAYQESPNGAQRLVSSTGCSTPDCVRLLVAEQVRTTYPDVTVQVRSPEAGDQGEAGIAIAVKDREDYYAITLQTSTGLVTTRRVTDGVTTVLGQVTAKLAAKPWHTIRVQRINFLHLDKGRLAVYVDGAQVAAVGDAVLPKDGRIGLITIGRTRAEFDNLHVLDLVSNRPLSKPAAY